MSVQLGTCDGCGEELYDGEPHDCLVTGSTVVAEIDGRAMTTDRCYGYFNGCVCRACKARETSPTPTTVRVLKPIDIPLPRREP